MCSETLCISYPLFRLLQFSEYSNWMQWNSFWSNIYVLKLQLSVSVFNVQARGWSDWSRTLNKVSDRESFFRDKLFSLGVNVIGFIKLAKKWAYKFRLRGQISSFSQGGSTKSLFIFGRAKKTYSRRPPPQLADAKYFPFFSWFWGWGDT